MSIVIGAVSSDTLYLIGDNRITYTNKITGESFYQDNFEKVKRITEDVAIGFAGQSRLAIELYNSIIKNVEAHKLQPFSDNVTAFCSEYIKHFFFNGESNIQIIVGGYDSNHNLCLYKILFSPQIGFIDNDSPIIERSDYPKEGGWRYSVISALDRSDKTVEIGMNSPGDILSKIN